MKKYVYYSGRRQRTLSGNMTSDYAAARARIVRIPLAELKFFRSSRDNKQIQFSSKQGLWQHTFHCQNGNADVFVANLRTYVITAKTRRNRNTYMVVESNQDAQVLNKSFAELDIFTENTSDVVWNMVSNFTERPYTTAMEAFSKFTDIGKCIFIVKCCSLISVTKFKLLIYVVIIL